MKKIFVFIAVLAATNTCGAAPIRIKDGYKSADECMANCTGTVYPLYCSSCTKESYVCPDGWISFTGTCTHSVDGWTWNSSSNRYEENTYGTCEATPGIVTTWECSDSGTTSSMSICLDIGAMQWKKASSIGEWLQVWK